MKTLNSTFLLLALCAGSALGQLQTANTTLATAVTAGSNAQFCLASGTGVAFPNSAQSGSILFVDQEAVVVTAPGGSANCFKVKRGQLGTGSGANHNVGATVWIGQAAPSSGDTSRPFMGVFVSARPSGGCNAALQYSLPVIVAGGMQGGEIVTCSNGLWVLSNLARLVNVGAALASATTIAPVSFVTHVTGTAAIATITPPPGFVSGGHLILIPDGIFTTTNAGNIAIASTAVVSKALILTWDATAAKWFPSY